MFVFSAPVLNVGHRNKNLFTITTRIVSRNFGKVIIRMDIYKGEAYQGLFMNMQIIALCLYDTFGSFFLTYSLLGQILFQNIKRIS